MSSPEKSGKDGRPTKLFQFVNNYNLRLRVQRPLCVTLGDQPARAVPPDDVPSAEQLFGDGNSHLGARYAGDMVAYTRRLEERRSLSVNFLSGPDAPVSPAMRSVLIDWLIEVQHYLSLCQDTLYLTVHILDHYFDGRVPIAMHILQLIAIGSLFIACKMEERLAPRIKKLLHLAEDAYQEADVLAMERRVFKAIDFNASFASPVIFVNLCLRAVGADLSKLQTLSYYLIDIVLHDLRSARIPASLMGAAATYLACQILLPERDDRRLWDRSVQWHSGYSEEDLQPVVARMIRTLIELPTSKYKGAFKKYASVSRYEALSRTEVLRPDAIEALRLPRTSTPRSGETEPAVGEEAATGKPS